MNPKISALLLVVIALACFITGILIYPQLPAIIATHWNTAGVANGFSNRFAGVFALPIIIAILDVIWAVLPAIDPIRPGFKGFRHIYDFFWILLSSLLAYSYALSLERDLGLSFNLFQAVLPGIAFLFLCVGALLPHVKRNWFFGIRTPWTLSSEAVWDKTQRVGGGLIILAALIAFAGVLYPAIAIWLLVVPVLSAALISIIYSYVLYRREH